MKRILFFTGTRADYGLLVPSAKKLQAQSDVEVGFLAAGNHFSATFGYTYQRILDDGFECWGKVALDDDQLQKPIAELVAITLKEISKQRILEGIDVFIILGDRFEALAAAQAAFYAHVPIVHLHAGEKTIGAQDDFIRHSISQLASVCITATEAYQKRCIQLGFAPDRVLNFGSPGQDNIALVAEIPREPLNEKLRIESRPFVLLTVHPETQNPEKTRNIIPAIQAALSTFPDQQIVATYPNMDEGYEVIIDQLIAWKQSLGNNLQLHENLGLTTYIQAARAASCVIGNSSSGLIEVPSLKTPTIDIGERQTGREHARSVQRVSIDETAIENALSVALGTTGFSEADFKNPYGESGFAERFTQWLIGELFQGSKLSSVREFYDVSFSAPPNGEA